ncbi:hypothetical protein [Streptomyces syringium]|uniref:hypothetical protein n=1 Tax=Streptomyces syringium TaxID=76729 RepID=UPI003452032B
MNARTLWFEIAVPALLTALLARALWAAAAIETSAQWLRTGSRRTFATDRTQAPWLVVLLPMLREQSVAPATVTAFTRLDYPRDRAAVVVITTEREETARRQARTRLPELAARNLLTPGELRGLFPAGRTHAVAAEANAARPADRLAVLTRLFDAEPSTAQVITTLTAGPPAGRLPVLHLHQPHLGGRKAGQLNYAADRLGQLLGPLGWREAEHAQDTFLVVYDADALPDTRTLHAFAEAHRRHQDRTGTIPALIQQQRLPLLARRPFPTGTVGLLLAGEWIYQLRRSLGIELARLRLHRWLAGSRLPEAARMALRPMVYAVGCGMAVHLPAIRALGGFPEPMEDLGTGHRLSLLGAPFEPSRVAVLDEPYTEPSGLMNLHALAFAASARPDHHAQAVAHLPTGLSRTAQAALLAREWADQAAWLMGAPLVAAAALSAWWAGPLWTAVAVAGIILHGPVPTARLLALAPTLHQALTPPAGLTPPPPPSPARSAALITASPLQPFVRLAGPWLMILRRITGHHTTFGKTER